MRVMKMSLALILGFTATLASASIVASKDDVVGVNLESTEASIYIEGYVQLNKTTQTISLILQPTMPACPNSSVCAAVMPDARDYFFEAVGKSVDFCNAVTYTAEQNIGDAIKVRVIDNTHYNYKRCPTFAPQADTVVEVEQTIQSAAGNVHFEGFLTGGTLETVQF